MKFKHLTPEQTNILKGVGILLIVLHNFFHNLEPIIGEQEFDYSKKIALRFWDNTFGRPEDALRIFFSYFGHYGVQIFIFLSAYGFTQKYKGAPPKYLEFFCQRTKKIYSAFFACVLLYVILGFAKEFATGEDVLVWKSILWKLTALSNFVPGEALSPVGPWWFFSLIIQIYAIFPLLLHGNRRFGVKFLLAISIVAIAAEVLLGPTLRSHYLNINHTVVGHLPVVCMGIYWGCKPRLDVTAPIFGVAFVYFVVGNFHPLMWLLADVAFILACIGAQGVLFRYLPLWSRTERTLAYFGQISLYLFLVNGFLRSPFHNLAQAHGLWWFDNLISIAFLLFATVFAIMLKHLENSPAKLRRAVKLI